MTEWKPTKAENPDFKCRSCGSNEVERKGFDAGALAMREAAQERPNSAKSNWMAVQAKYYSDADFANLMAVHVDAADMILASIRTIDPTTLEGRP